jgi:hypothetical protein
MKSLRYGFQSGEEGKGSLGCIFSIALMVIVVFVAFKLGPVYFNHYEFKGELQQVVSRAGARSVQDEVIIQDIIRTAEKSKIILKKENIQIRRLAGQLNITVEYTVPINLLVTTYNRNFKLEESSFTLV